MHFKLQILIALIALSITTGIFCEQVIAFEPLAVTGVGKYVSTINWCGCNYVVAGGFNADRSAGLATIYQLNQTTESLISTTNATFGGIVYAAQFNPLCNFLALGGADSNFTNGIIQIYSFNSPTLEPLPNLTMLGYQVNAIGWDPAGSYLVAGGIASDQIGGILQAYSFDGTNLSTTGNPLPLFPNSINSVKWCDNGQYLAAVDNTSTIYIYTFNTSTGLNFAASYLSTASYQSIDWCNGCGYIAAAGQRNNSKLGVIDVYKFDPTSTSSISYITTVTIPSSNYSEAVSVAWCQGCDNLAFAGYSFDGDESDYLKLYHFYSATETLSWVQTYTLPSNLSVNIYPAALVDWCTSCSYITLGGYNSQNGDGFIQLFKSEFPVPPNPSAPSNPTAQKFFHRFPSQVDIINTICWDAVADAVAYNVYADEALSIFLATITNPPLCYSQHQIRSGSSSTYYITAVNELGYESQPAVVTI